MIDFKTLMYIACCECRRIIDVKHGPLGKISHTFCEKCLPSVMKRTKEDLEKIERQQNENSNSNG